MYTNMKNPSKPIFMIGSLLLLILLLNTSSTKAQEVEDEREFDYIKGSDKGPSRWGYLREEWAACKDGKMQSPIDMSNERVKIIRNPDQRNYKPANATLKNRGHDIMVQWGGDAGSILINGTEYPLRQAHWHSPSEHTIHGGRYAMELHMVHQNSQNDTAVIGVLFKIGRPDPFLAKLTRSLKSMEEQEVDEIQIGTVDPREINIYSKLYYRYLGSLTTPPCTEGVVWTINKEVRTVSIDQVKLLRDAVHDYAENNARPKQARNHRDIYLYALHKSA